MSGTVSHAPTIAFDAASGNVLCKADGGGKYTTLESLRVEKRLQFGDVVEYSKKPQSGISPITVKTSRGNGAFRLLIRRTRIGKSLDVDSEYEKKQRLGDFLPMNLDVGSNGVISLLCLMDATAKLAARKVHSEYVADNGADLRRGINKYWHGSVEFVRPNHPPSARFVLLDDLPGAALMEAAQEGSPVDIQLTLRGVVYYQRFTALAWSVDSLRVYEHDDDDDEAYDNECDNECDRHVDMSNGCGGDGYGDQGDSDQGDSDAKETTPQSESANYAEEHVAVAEEHAAVAEEHATVAVTEEHAAVAEEVEKVELVEKVAVAEEVDSSSCIRAELMSQQRRLLTRLEDDDIDDDELELINHRLSAIKRRMRRL